MQVAFANYLVHYVLELGIHWLCHALCARTAHTLCRALYAKKKKSSALNGVVKLMCAGDPEALALILRELIMETRDIVALLQLPLCKLCHPDRAHYIADPAQHPPPAQPSHPSRIRLPSATRCTANASMAKIHRDGVSGAAPRQQLWRLVQRRGRQRCWKRHQQQPPPAA